jgi:hypothetical protein
MKNLLKLLVMAIVGCVLMTGCHFVQPHHPPGLPPLPPIPVPGHH